MASPNYRIPGTAEALHPYQGCKPEHSNRHTPAQGAHAYLRTCTYTQTRTHSKTHTHTRMHWCTCTHAPDTTRSACARAPCSGPGRPTQVLRMPPRSPPMTAGTTWPPRGCSGTCPVGRCVWPPRSYNTACHAGATSSRYAFLLLAAGCGWSFLGGVLVQRGALWCLAHVLGLLRA